MTSKEYLIEARALISNPDNWVRYCLSANTSGEWALFSQACRFDASGAVYRVAPQAEHERLDRILTDAAYKLGFICADTLNDITDHETVMKMFDLAIEAA